MEERALVVRHRGQEGKRLPHGVVIAQHGQIAPRQVVQVLLGGNQRWVAQVLAKEAHIGP